MKTTAKTKKTSATKAPVKATKTSSKTPVKSTKVSAKSSAKTTAKSVVKAKAPAKAVAKVAAKSATKAVKVVKSAAKAPVKAAKAPIKAAKSAKSTKAAPVKAVKAAKPAPKAVVKAAPAVKVKEIAQKSVAKAPVTAKTTAKAPSAVASAKPIVVSMPMNQNNAPVRTPTPVVMAVRPVTTANKLESSDVARPVYRPIQVINKPLTPVQATRPMAPVAKSDEKVEFKKGDYVVYPAHGVGEIENVETQIIGGMEIKLYAIMFEKDRMRLKVPVFKAHASGLRRLSTTNRMQDALKTLQGRAQVRRAMWSRRAQEYETKINSGDPVSIAEVLRDLKRSNDESEQSYSERQIYQSALERLAREVAAVEKITEIEAAERLENMIRGKRARAAAAQAEETATKEAANA